MPGATGRWYWPSGKLVGRGYPSLLIIIVTSFTIIILIVINLTFVLPNFEFLALLVTSCQVKRKVKKFDSGGKATAGDGGDVCQRGSR